MCCGIPGKQIYLLAMFLDLELYQGRIARGPRIYLVSLYKFRALEFLVLE